MAKYAFYITVEQLLALSSIYFVPKKQVFYFMFLIYQSLHKGIFV